MTIVVGYIPRPEGLAAVDAAIVEAERRGERLVVVNTGHHGDNTDPSYAAPQDLDALDAQLTARGVEHEIRQPNRRPGAGRRAARRRRRACGPRSSSSACGGAARWAS